MRATVIPATGSASSAVRPVVIGTAAINPIDPTSVATTSFATTSRLRALPTPRSAALKSNRIGSEAPT